jgi:hypothetical protein
MKNDVKITCSSCNSQNPVTTYKCSSCDGSLAKERLSHLDRLFREIETEKASGYNAFKRYMWFESAEEDGDYSVMAHTLANLQLQDVCASVSRKAISIDFFKDYIEELEIIADRAAGLLTASITDPAITLNVAAMIKAMTQFKEMVSMAGDYEKELDGGVLEYSLSMAMEADEAIHTQCLAIEKKRQ